MIILVLFILGRCDQIQFNATMNYTLRPQQYGTIMPNSFQLFKQNSEYKPGNISMNLTLTAKIHQPFDLFFFNSPFNQMYVCYIHMMMFENVYDCGCLMANLCSPCSDYNPELINDMWLNYAFKDATVYNGEIEIATPSNTLCYLGCHLTEKDYAKQLLNLTTDISTLNNSAGIIVVQNSDFPSINPCNYTTTTNQCLNGQLTNIQDEERCPETNLTYFCGNLFSVYCRNLGALQDLTLSILYDLSVQPNQEQYERNMLIIVLCLIIIACITILLCVLGFRYKRIKTQQRDFKILKKSKAE